MTRHALNSGTPYEWNLQTGQFVIGGIRFPLVTVGTVSGDSFMWSWANEAIPASGKVGIERLRDFGREHDLDLLMRPCVSGGLAQAKQCVAIAGRVLDASGFWIDRTNDGQIAFVIHDPAA